MADRASESNTAPVGPGAKSVWTRHRSPPPRFDLEPIRPAHRTDTSAVVYARDFGLEADYGAPPAGCTPSRPGPASGGRASARASDCWRARRRSRRAGAGLYVLGQEPRRELLAGRVRGLLPEQAGRDAARGDQVHGGPGAVAAGAGPADRGPAGPRFVLGLLPGPAAGRLAEDLPGMALGDGTPLGRLTLPLFMLAADRSLHQVAPRSAPAWPG